MAPIVSVPGQLGYIHACTSTKVQYIQYDVQEAIAARYVTRNENRALDLVSTAWCKLRADGSSAASEPSTDFLFL